MASRRYSLRCNGVEVASFDVVATAKAFQAKIQQQKAVSKLGKAPVWALLDTVSNPPTPVP